MNAFTNTAMNALKQNLLSVAVVAMALALLAVQVLASHDWNPRAFVLETPAGVSPERGYGVGYDGRFVYQLAINPWGSTEGLDQPNYRYQRILYPLLVKLLSMGRVAWAPWVMLGVNILSAAAGCGILSCLLQRRGVHPWFSLVFFFSLGYLLSVRLDLLEPLTFALCLGGLLAFDIKRVGRAAGLFALAGLAKEVALIFPIAMILWLVMRKAWRNACLLALSLVPYVIWYTILLGWLGTSPEAIEKSRPVLIPFWGFQYLTDPASRLMVALWVLLPAIVFGAWSAIDLGRQAGHATGREAMLVLANVALIATLPAPTWVDPLAILRLGLGLLVAVLLWLALAHRRFLPYAAAWWLPSGLVFVMALRII